MDVSYIIKKRDSPIISAALHDGHFIPSNILTYLLLQEHERFREEDPYTALFADLPTNQIVVNSSRFMVDMNRSKDKAIYKTSKDAWGLQLWKKQFPKHLEKELLDYYSRFYKEVAKLITETIHAFGYFLILDIHSYNHRRVNPDTPASSMENPEINIGTANNLSKWRPVIEKFIGYLANTTIKGKKPDVRENIKFKGGRFSQWAIKEYGNNGCVLSVEFKKTFMDEWTGRADFQHIRKISKILKGSIPLLQSELEEM